MLQPIEAKPVNVEGPIAIEVPQAFPETAAAPSHIAASDRKSAGNLLAKRAIVGGHFSRMCRDGCASVGEWLGIVGPAANWLSRFTVAAVVLVLVSGTSLILAPSAIEPVVEADVEPARDVSVEHAPANTAREAPLAESNPAIQRETSDSGIQPVGYESASRSHRGAWLSGTIEVE